MASLFGFFNKYHAVEEILQNMFEALRCRGGESKEIYNDSHLTMGIRGNSSYLKKALVMNPSKTIIAVIEGEIYNSKELKNILGHETVGFQQDNVFEAIILLYEKFGKDFPKYLNGIFAIALWDSNKRILYLVRDHLGSHSLFYTQTPPGLFFASTIRALLHTGLVNRELSLSAMNAYFASTAISSPTTMFTDIFCVRPGTMVICDANGTCSDYEYWRSQDIHEDYQRPEEDFVEKVREFLLDAIKIRADFGGKYGSLLSGGIDTSIIAATLANQRKYERLAGFSITFEEIFYNDAELQNIMYTQYNIDPQITTLGANEFADILQKGVAYLDKPVNDDAYVGMYKAFELAKQAGYDVIFDGEAADELFFTRHAYGEKSFQKFLFLPLWFRRLTFGKLIPSIPIGDSLWKKGWRLLYKIGLSDEERILTRLPCFYNHATKILLNYDTVSSEDPLAIGKKYLVESALQDPLNRYHYGILKTFLTDDLLFKNERMASANGIINRTPFIDYRLVELAFQIPAKYKLTPPTEHDDGTKQIYKKAIKGLIPDEILYRKKQRGFSQPSSLWYRHELKDFVYDTLFSQKTLCLDYVNKKYMFQLFSEHVSGKSNFDRLLNSLLIFEFWLRAFLK